MCKKIEVVKLIQPFGTKRKIFLFKSNFGANIFSESERLLPHLIEFHDAVDRCNENQFLSFVITVKNFIEFKSEDS